jgi:DNA-3-methyladenine glycosylase I
MDEVTRRCPWAGADPLYVAYHDEEWGVPLHDDRRLFELLLLEGAQAGLSWITILRKRDNYRAAFEGFDPARLARYGARDVARLMANPGIVRNRLKIAASITNARAFLAVAAREGSFDRYLWRVMDGKPRQNRWTSLRQVPARTPESDALSHQLKRDGFKFVGSTICYAFMQAVGMVNDHVVACFRHAAVRETPRRADGPSRSVRGAGSAREHIDYNDARAATRGAAGPAVRRRRTRAGR